MIRYELLQNFFIFHYIQRMETKKDQFTHNEDFNFDLS